MRDRKAELLLEDFPSRSFDKIRCGDLSLEGHVSNVIFPAFCETGRAEIVRDPEFRVLTQGFIMFIGRFAIDYRAELFWPGRVEIGTGVKAVGRSSVTVFQGLFQNGKCAASAQTVLVHVDGKTSCPVPLAEETKAWLAKFALELK